MAGKRILVTGAAGFLGSVLCPMLLAEGYHVVAIDNLMYRQTSLVECCWDPNFEMHVMDAASFREICEGCEFAVALAAIVGAPACKAVPVEAFKINAEAIGWLANWCRNTGAHLILPNTNSGYGTTGAASCDETTQMRPISVYGETKLQAEQFALRAGGTVFRFATLFGVSPRMRFDLLVNDFTLRAIRDRSIVLFEPHFRRNYLHVRDAASAIIHAIKHRDTMAGQVYNAGLQDANLTKRQLCDVIKRHLPDLAILESETGSDPDKRDYLVDNSKLLATGWWPQYTLDDGIRELVKAAPIYLRAQPWSNA